MMLQAVITSSTRPEYGETAIPLPIPDEDYERTMELLKGLDIGDVLAQDCRIVELASQYPVLDRLEGAAVNVDELDYLAKRLESFCKSEDDQFLAMAHKMNLTDIKDFINLTFCCQQATVITNFSDLERVGWSHRMNINGGTMPMEEYNALDGRQEALKLILNERGIITPYGVVYDNGMKLEPLYDGRHFPSYLHKPPVLALETVSDDAEGFFCLPMPERQMQRMIERTGLKNQSIPLKIVMDELPETVGESLDIEHLCSDALPVLNRMCQTIEPLKKADMEKLNAVVLMAEAGDMMAVRQLAANLDQFDFIPNIHTPEEYGRYMIQESGRFSYDENLVDFYDYRHYGEQRVQAEGGQFNKCGYVAYAGTIPLEELMQDDPAGQRQQEPGMQMGGAAW